MKAIVTGANGFVGSGVVKKLIDNNIEVLAIDLSFFSSKLPLSNLITIKELSIENIERLEKEIKKGCYDLFYHFAWVGVNGPKKGDFDCQIQNIKMTIKCAEFANRIGVKKFLCSGTIAEKSIESVECLSKIGPSVVYGAAKDSTRTLLTAYCKSVGLDCVWMQFSNIYGKGNTTGNIISYTLSKLANNEPATFGPANQPYDFVHIDDLIEAVFLLGIRKTSGNFYFIGSGKPQRLSKYLMDIGNITGKSTLVQLGVREDDGIRYTFEMFDIGKTVKDIGDYVKHTFREEIKSLVENIDEQK